MSYLDSLENNLKAMEGREERGSRRDEARVRQELDRARAAATAPFAEQLRRGPFAAELMNEAVRIGHGLRTKVYISWLDGALRLEARDLKLELKATADGVQASFFEQGRLANREIVSLDGSAKRLAERWLDAMPRRPAA